MGAGGVGAEAAIERSACSPDPFRVVASGLLGEDGNGAVAPGDGGVRIGEQVAHPTGVPLLAPAGPDQGDVITGHHREHGDDAGPSGLGATSGQVGLDPGSWTRGVMVMPLASA